MTRQHAIRAPPAPRRRPYYVRQGQCAGWTELIRPNRTAGTVTAMGAGPEVSVVLATHNRSERLSDLLDSLRGQTLARDAFEVIVVDDGSSDDTGAVLDSAVA